MKTLTRFLKKVKHSLTILDLIGFSFVIIFGVVVTCIASSVSNITIINILIQCNIVFLGLFGVFSIYLLTYYSNIIIHIKDKIETNETELNTLHYYKQDKKDIFTENRCGCLRSKLQKYNNSKQEIYTIMLLTFISLIISIICLLTISCLSTLGVSIYAILPLSICMGVFLSLSLGLVFGLFLYIGKIMYI